MKNDLITKRYLFHLNINYHQCIALYQDKTQAILLAESGEKVQMPIENLRRMITRDGLVGKYELVTHNKKITSFKKLD
jgi:hypothetical protein